MSIDFSTNSLSAFDSGNNQEPDIIFPLASDRNAHESDTTCTSCGCKYDVPGLAHTRKTFCHFCYRGQCSRCNSYEYYHSETKSYQPMCSGCHVKLTAMSEDFLNEIKECRLERMELKKAINLAMQEKKLLERERQIKAEELQDLKESLKLEGADEEETLESLKNRKIELKNKENEVKSRMGELEYELSELSRRFDKEKHALDGFNNKRKQEKEQNKELTEELREVEFKVAAYKREKNEVVTEETRLAEIEVLKQQITELERKKSKKHEKTEKMKERLHEIKNDIRKNNGKIEDAQEKLEALKSEDPDIFTDEQCLRIDEVKKQIKELDEIVILNQQRLEHKKEVNGKKTEGRSYANSLELDYSKLKSSQAKSNGDDQKGCCAKCFIF